MSISPSARTRVEHLVKLFRRLYRVLFRRKMGRPVHNSVEKRRRTNRQTNAMIRIAKELISAIEVEGRTRATGEPNVQSRVNRGFYPSYFELLPEQARERVQSLTLRFT